MRMLITLALMALDPAVPPAAPSLPAAPSAVPRAASPSLARSPAAPRAAAGDGTLRRVQAGATEMPAMPFPPYMPAPGGSEPVYVGNSVSLQAALLGAVTSNPDLVTLRNSNVASPEAVEVARRFPTTLNPTLWVDFRPITLIPPDTFANRTGRHAARFTTMARSSGTSRTASRSSSGTRRRTATPSPGPRSTSRTGTCCRAS